MSHKEAILQRLRHPIAENSFPIQFESHKSFLQSFKLLVVKINNNQTNCERLIWSDLKVIKIFLQLIFFLGINRNHRRYHQNENSFWCVGYFCAVICFSSEILFQDVFQEFLTCYFIFSEFFGRTRRDKSVQQWVDEQSGF